MRTRMRNGGYARFAASVSTCLIFGDRHFDHVLRAYRVHHNRHRPHRSLALHPPHAVRPAAIDRPTANVRVCRRDLLGGLIHQYELAE